MVVAKPTGLAGAKLGIAGGICHSEQRCSIHGSTRNNDVPRCSETMHFRKGSRLKLGTFKVSTMSMTLHLCCHCITPAASGHFREGRLQCSVIRLGLLSKGWMAEGTLNLLTECSLLARKINPRQYIADIPGLDNLEVWIRREADVVRKLRTGDMPMGILGYDILAEFGEDDEDLIIVHHALGFGFG